MQMLRRLALLSLAVGLTVAACDDDDPSGPAPETFRATLNGASESPPVTTTAEGTGTFTLTGNDLDYTIVVTNWPAGRTITAAHIHAAPAAGQPTGGIIQGFPVNAGGIGTTGGSGRIGLSQSVADQVRAGGTYFNIHSSVNGGGEIRGTLVRQ
jgi:hypothetical protein